MGIMNGKYFAHLDLTIALDIVYKEYNGTMLINDIFSVVCVFWRLLGSCFLAQQARCFDIHSNHDELCAEYVKFQL